MRSPASQDRTGRRRWLSWTLAGVVGAALLAVALWLCVWVLPQRWYPPLSNADLVGLSPADQAARREGRDKLHNDARSTLLQGLAGVLVLVGAGFGGTVALRQVRIGLEQLEQARRQAQRSDKRARQQLKLARKQAQRSDERLREQITLAQEGQITERFTRAIDQLGQPGPDRLDVRLGGIYALERIARDSPADRATIGEVLTAFIRGHAPWPPRLPDQPAATMPIDQVPELQVRAPDVQASLTVLGRGGFAHPEAGSDRLDLHAVDLRHADLSAAHLEAAIFRGAHLEGAYLSAAHLEGADLFEACLDGAGLLGAHLEGANLESAHLTEAKLDGADLTQAFLLKAHLERAHMTKANLEGATLWGARLEGANLGGATLENATLGDAHLEGAIIGGVNFEGAFLVGVHVQGARADHLTRWSGESDWRAAGVTFE